MAQTSCIDGKITPLEIVEGINIIQEQLNTNNGFDRQNMASLGVVEFCPLASAGITYGYETVGGITTFYEKTAQTNFAEGTVWATPLVDRTVVMYPNTGEVQFDVYLDNGKTEYTTLQSVQIHTDCSDGLHYFYYSADTGLFTQAQSPTEDLIKDCAIACITYCNLSTGKMVLFGNEQHGIAMDGIVHSYLHENFGALYTSGLGINGLTSGLGSYTSIDSGSIADEDINNYSGAQTNTPFWYKEGASGIWTADATPNLELALNATTYHYYNEWTGTVWQLTEMGNNSYILVHFFRTNDGKYPMVKVIGEENYNTPTLARAGATVEINNLMMDGLPTPEFVSCYTMIVDQDGNLILNEDGSEYLDWRTINAIGSGGTSATTTLHADLTDTDTDGHPVSVISGAAALDVAQTFTKPQRTSATAEDNTIDFTLTQDFTITLGSSLTITVGSITGCDGQTGVIVVSDSNNIAAFSGFTWLGTVPTGMNGVGLFSYKIVGTTVYMVKAENV